MYRVVRTPFHKNRFAGGRLHVANDGTMTGSRGGTSLPPQLRGVVAAAGCQKGLGWMKRDRENTAAVPRQSRHTSH
jgi:hypothetical protein